MESKPLDKERLRQQKREKEERARVKEELTSSVRVSDPAEAEGARRRGWRRIRRGEGFRVIEGIEIERVFGARLRGEREEGRRR